MMADLVPSSMPLVGALLSSWWMVTGVCQPYQPASYRRGACACREIPGILGLFDMMHWYLLPAAR